jgi:hypothetical protein
MKHTFSGFHVLHVHEFVRIDLAASLLFAKLLIAFNDLVNYITDCIAQIIGSSQLNMSKE